MNKKAKANFKSIGPKYGKSAKQIAARIKELSGAEIAMLEKDGSLSLDVVDTSATILREDVEILREDMPGCFKGKAEEPPTDEFSMPGFEALFH